MTDITAFDLLLTKLTILLFDARLRIIELGTRGLKDGRTAWIGPMQGMPSDVIPLRRLLLAGRVRTPSFVKIPATGRLQENGVDYFRPPGDMLRVVTTDTARAIGLDSNPGSLKIGIGKRADLIAFDFHSPHLVPCIKPTGNLIHAAHRQAIEQAWVNGVQVMETGRPTQGDLDRIHRDGQQVSLAPWQPASAA